MVDANNEADHIAGPQQGARRPLWIGITTKHGSADWISRNTHNYVRMVETYGAIPIVLAPDAAAKLPDGTVYEPDALGRLDTTLLDRLDGLILSGGGDVNPRYFGQGLGGAERKSIDDRRDELEISLSQAALAKDLPVFAICRGCQVLNVAAGGGLVQHFDGHRTPEGGPTNFHDVVLQPESKLRTIVQQETLPVNTYHHQGVDEACLAPLFHTAAVAQPDSWIVEAYESREHRWVVGVQWHPERNFELDHGHIRIWDSFIAACSNRHEAYFAWN
jgi:putative glutamine amidotransferase